MVIVRFPLIKLILSVFSLCFIVGLNAQSLDYGYRERNSLRIMFYNVENLFDTFDDTLKNDNEFLPTGNRYWTTKKLDTKINNLFKTIIATGNWNPPEIIGLCEVENFYVLNQLVNYTPFSKFQYRIIHHDSPDTRGIDVALLYSPNKYQIIDTAFVEINFPDELRVKTREILYVKGIFNRCDTLHIFVNHWPSRAGSEKGSEHKRVHVATTLKSFTDSILHKNSNADIIIMGDFNDNPTDRSINILANKEDGRLVNLSGEFVSRGEGTLKYRGQWNMFDQFIVSKHVYENNCKKMEIATHEFLLIDDEEYIGKKPFRTYSGYRYTGGFSDHLPVYIDFKYGN